MKKLLALVLALVMVMSLCITSNAAFAGEDIDYKEAVEVMSAVGVLQGDENGKFNPDGTLTREQAAKIICYMLLGKTAADSLSAASAPFADVAADRWSAGAIAYCASEGILAGVGNGKFDPTGTLTGYAFAKMCLVALGYDADVEGYTGSQWAINVAKRVIAIDLDSDLDVALSNGISRQEAAQMAFNTLTADLVAYTGGINVTTGDGTNINVDSTRYVVDDIGNTAARHYDGTDDDKTQFCERYMPKLKKENTTNSYGVMTDYWYLGNNDTDAVRTNAKTVTSAASATVLATYTTDVDTITAADLYNLTGSATALDIFENGINSTINVTPAKGVTTKVFTAYAGATVKVLDNDADGTADRVVVEYPYVAKVTKVTEATKTADRFVTMTVYNKTATVTGVEFDTEDFAKDDYVLVYVSGKIATTDNAATIAKADIIDVKAAETVKGTASTVSGNNGATVTALTVEGTKYTVAADNFAKMAPTANTATKANTYTFTNTYTLVLSNGFVIGTAGQPATADTSKVVYATAGTYNKTDAYGDTTTMVQVVNLDGTVEELVNDGDANGTSDANKSGGGAIAAGFYTKAYNSTHKTYTLTAVGATGSIDNTTVFFGATTLGGNKTMKATDGTITTTAGKAYITSGSDMLFVTDSKADVKVSVKTGAIAQTFANAKSTVLLSKDTKGNLIVEAIVTTDAIVDVSGTVVFINGTATGTNKTGSEYTMYAQDGTKTTVTCKAGNAPTTGFATYEIDEDGAYKFVNVGAGAANGDGVYNVDADATIYGTLLSNNETPALTDLEAKDASIVNIVTNGTIKTLEDIAASTTVKATALVKDKVVLAIFVTDESGYVLTAQTSGIKFYDTKAHAQTNDGTTGLITKAAAGATVYAVAAADNKDIASTSGFALNQEQAKGTSQRNIVSFTMPGADLADNEFTES